MASKATVIEMCRGDLLTFGRVVTPAMFQVKSAGFHRELADIALDFSLDKVSIMAPRGHAKSSIMAGLLPLHHLMFHDGPKFIVLVSKTEGHAVKLLQTIKDVLDHSQTFRALFGYWGQHSARSWKRTEVELKDGSFILCRGANQQMRGLKHINQRPTLVIYDDPEDENNTKTDEARATNFNGLTKGIVPGKDRKSGRVFVIGTPIHSRGMVNVLEEMPNWHSVKYKALIEKEGVDADTPERERYTALWPEIWSVDQLLREREALEAIGKGSAFYSEYQCEIVGDEEALFREEDIRYWKGTVEWDARRNPYLIINQLGEAVYDEPIHVPVNIFMGVDLASSTSKLADRSVIFVIALDEEGRVFCVDYWLGRKKPMQVAERIVAMYRKYRPSKTNIETVAYQEMMRDYLRTHISEYIPGLERKNNPRKGKTERIEGLQPEFAKGIVYVAPHMSEFVSELLLFPRGKHDDTVDAYYYARKGAYRPFHEVCLDPSVLDRDKRPPAYDWMTT